MARNYGNWKVGNYPGVVVTDERTGSYAGYFDREEWEMYELKNYGGYVLAESIQSKDDALVIAAASDLHDACKQILTGIDSLDRNEFFNGINSARKALNKANPQPKRISEFSQTTISRIEQIIQSKNL